MDRTRTKTGWFVLALAWLASSGCHLLLGGADIGVDGSRDARVDAIRDGRIDGSVDARRDSALDGALDALTDAMLDLPFDASPDALPDVILDVALDVVADVALDQPPPVDGLADGFVASPPCTSQALNEQLLGGGVAYCGGNVSQCIAPTLCGTGWELCSAHDYYSRLYPAFGAAISPPPGNAWLRACVDSFAGDGTTTPSPLKICGTCAALGTHSYGDKPCNLVGTPLQSSIPPGVMALPSGCYDLDTPPLGVLGAPWRARPVTELAGALCCRSPCQGPIHAPLSTYNEGKMAICSRGLSLVAGHTQCAAPTACSAGYHLCSAQEYLENGGAVTSPAYQAWLAVCVREPAGVGPVYDSSCTACPSLDAGTPVDNPACGDGGQPFASSAPSIAFRTSTFQTQLPGFIPTGAYSNCAYWVIQAATDSKMSACCSD